MSATCTVRSRLRVFLLSLCACALYVPGNRAEGQVQTPQVQTPQVQAGPWAYAFLLPPFLIRTNWVFASPGGLVLAPTPQALSVRIGGERPDSPQSAQALYDRIGALGWELISCSRDDQDAAPGWSGPGCIFKKRL